MMIEIQRQKSQSIVKGKVQMISGYLVEVVDEHITVEEYKRIIITFIREKVYVK